jgi:hypothetical protein
MFGAPILSLLQMALSGKLNFTGVGFKTERF